MKMTRVQKHNSFSHSIRRARKREIEKAKKNLLKRYQASPAPAHPPTPNKGSSLARFIAKFRTWLQKLLQ